MGSRNPEFRCGRLLTIPALVVDVGFPTLCSVCCWWHNRGTVDVELEVRLGHVGVGGAFGLSIGTCVIDPVVHMHTLRVRRRD